MKRTNGKGQHGYLKDGAKPPEYALWKMWIQRCHNPTSAGYERYGGLGTRVADRWLDKDGFPNFLADVGRQPFAGAGLRLRDPQGHFEPGNVAWANTRAKHMLTYDGRTQSLAAWAVERGMNERTLRKRLRQGWFDDAILTRQLANRDHLASYRSRARKKAENTDGRVAS